MVGDGDVSEGNHVTLPDKLLQRGQHLTSRTVGRRRPVKETLGYRGNLTGHSHTGHLTGDTLTGDTLTRDTLTRGNLIGEFSPFRLLNVITAVVDFYFDQLTDVLRVITRGV